MPSLPPRLHARGSRRPSSFPSPLTGAPGEGPDADVYGDLLRGTRPIRHEDAQLRDIWFAKLRSERKEDHLFELETLLKGLACFANPRNHGGPRRRVAVAAQDFGPHVDITRSALGRIVMLTKLLLAQGDRAFVFQRYLETVLPDDAARAALTRPDRATPDGSLFALRHGMTNVLEVATGLSRLPRVPYRLFFALLGTGQREVQDSPFFNSLSALEFRPEFDRIQNPQLLQLIRGVTEGQAKRLVALTFLTLFRLLRYVSVIEQRSIEGDLDGRRFVTGTLQFTWAVLRSDARALTQRLSDRARELLAESFDRELSRIPASAITERFPAMLADAHHLRGIRGALEGVAANLRLEMRRVFEHDLPAPDSGATENEIRLRCRAAAAHLRPGLQNSILVLGAALGTRLDEHGVFDDHAERRLMSDRLRRDIWMFAQIVRAFCEKARNAGDHQERWSDASPFAFVGEFLSYFRAMGYPLVRAADYVRLDPFLESLERIRDVDRIDPQRIANAAEEGELFRTYLLELFENIGRRDELQDLPFDRRAAAMALRLYLGSH